MDQKIYKIYISLDWLLISAVWLYFFSIKLGVKNTSLLNPAKDTHRRQAGVSDENEEGGCEYERVQPYGMECEYATLHRLSKVSCLIKEELKSYEISLSP